MKSIFLFILLLLGIRADVLYLSTIGSDESDGSQSKPYATLHKAIEVYYTNGTYT